MKKKLKKAIEILDTNLRETEGAENPHLIRNRIEWQARREAYQNVLNHLYGFRAPLNIDAQWRQS